jgi:hypothetical protein
VYAIPLGLAVDVAGFILVILYGHTLFIRSGTGPPDDNQGRDGDLYLQTRNRDNVGNSSGTIAAGGGGLVWGSGWW